LLSTSLIVLFGGALHASRRRLAAEVEERRRAQEQLARSQRLFERIADTTPDILYLHELHHGQTLYCNREVGLLLGYTREEVALMSQGIADQIHPEDLPRIRASSANLAKLADGQVFQHEYRMRHADGSYRWIRSRDVVFERDEKGRPRALLGLAQDVTADRLAAQTLRDSEERFRRLAAMVPSIIWTASPDGTITFANERWFRYCGIDPERNARGWPELVLHPDDYERCVSEWTKALREGTEYEIEVRNRRHDGVYRWFVTRAVPRKDSQGRIESWFGVTTDIHDLKELQEAQRQNDRRKDEFLAILSHELRNPLAPVCNSLEILRLADRSAQRDGALAVMERQIGHLVRLVDDLLDISRITCGKIELRQVRLDLATVVRSAIETSRPLIDEFGHELTVTLPDEPVHVEGDPTRLAQVFANLLNNAAKYKERGGQIRLVVRREEDEVEVHVADSGVGIASDQLPRLFELFTQVDGSLDRAQGGLGIGLSLVKGLVQMHGGNVVAHSDGPGKGSTFVVRLPLAAAPVSAVADWHRSSPGRRRILVADDNEDGADSLATLLRMHGHEVYVAYDGESAVKAVDEFVPQVVLLDIGMPILNGYEAAGQIRTRRGRAVVLVAMTGWGQERDKQRAAQAGFDHHLTKPVDLDTLARLLAEEVSAGS
jgi:PAS domain S-box-containing protein